MRYWELLVWMDPANYGGILEQTMGTAAMRGAAATDTGKKRKRKRQLNFDDSLEPSLFEELDEASEEGEEEGEEDRDLFRTGDKLDVAVDMQWDIMGYLPQELCQEHFQLIVGTPPPSYMHAHQAPSPNGTDTQSSRTPFLPPRNASSQATGLYLGSSDAIRQCPPVPTQRLNYRDLLASTASRFGFVPCTHAAPRMVVETPPSSK